MFLIAITKVKEIKICVMKILHKQIHRYNIYKFHTNFTIPNIEFLIFFSDVVCLPSHDDFHSIYTAVGVWHIKNITIKVISTMVILFSCTIKVSLCINMYFYIDINMGIEFSMKSNNKLKKKNVY